jgi:gliding motility-associated-like protein
METRVKSYQEVTYKNIYKDIDWKIYSENDFLKHSFILHQGSSIESIRLNYKGVEKLELRQGKLIITTSVGKIIEDEPYVYQTIDGKVSVVDASYELNNGEISYKVGKYDKDYDLIIDPSLIFSTYSGSHSDNWGFTSCYDSRGNMFSGGICNGGLFPTTEGSYDTTYNGDWDCVIAKYDTNGSNRLFATYLGGLNAEMPHSMVINQNDELVVLGTTGSINFPTTNGAYQEFFNGGSVITYEGTLHFPNGVDMFLACLNRDGDSLIASTFIGGTDNDGLNFRNSYGNSYSTLYNGNDSLYYNYGDCARGEVITDSHNNIYVGSCTFSSDFPTTTGAFQDTLRGRQEGVVFKIDHSLSSLLFSSFIGGTNDDAVYSIDIDNSDRVYVCGGTNSTNFPTTSGAYNTSYNGGSADGFLALISNNGTQLLSSTFFGSSAYDQAYFVRTDRNNYPHIYGQTKASGSTLIYNAQYNIPNSGQFVAKFKPNLDSVVWSTVFGTGDNRVNISPSGFAVDICNRIYCSGWGRVFKYMSSSIGINTLGTTNMQTTSNAYMDTTDGQDFYIMSLSSDASTLDYATFFGEYSTSPYSGCDHVDGGTSRFDKYSNLYQTVCASCQGSQGFPTTVNCWSDSNRSANCNMASLKFSIHNDFAVADFITPDIVCKDSVIHFINSSRGTTYQWTFGDGGVSTATNPTHTYHSGGVFDVTLVSHLDDGCKDNDTITKKVIVLSDSSYHLDSLSTCPNTPVALGIEYFSLSNDSSISFSWSPSSLVTDSTIANPYAVVSSPTTFRLIIRTPSCFDTLYQYVGIKYLNINLEDTLHYCSLPYVYTIPNDNNYNINLSWTSAFTQNLPFNHGNNTYIITDSINRYLYVRYSQENCYGIDSIYLDYNGGEVNVATINVGCNSDHNGEATVTTSGFTPPLHYYWSCTTNDTNHVYNLTVGSYNVTVTDDKGCSVTKNFTIDAGINLSSVYSKVDVPCLDVCNGSIILNVTGGQTPYNILWSNGDTTMTINNLCSGDYSFILTDQHNCELKDTIPINVIDTLVLDISHTNNVCESGCSATASSNISGGTFPYIYSWSNGANTKDVTDLCNGNYTLIVTDSNGCKVNGSVEVTYTNIFENFNISASQGEVYDGAEITLSATYLDGFSYVWTPNEYLNTPNNYTTTGTIYTTTTYFVYVTDNKGCSLTDTVNVKVDYVECGKPNIYVPNVFTPNGDGKNDKVFVTGQWIEKMDFAIYDRWGEKVFEAKDMSEGWDGNYNGHICQAGVYYYRLNINCYGGKTYTTGGDITLIR